MTTIFYAEPALVIALNTKVIFLNPNDLQIFKEILLPHDLQEYGFETKDAKEPSTEYLRIQQVCLSPNGQLLAVTTSGQKALLLYQCRPEHAKLVSVRSLARTSSALTFSNNSNKVLVTDKAGDCYEYDCTNYETPPKLLLGHLSIVYDVAWTADEKLIITCDRDDKIRVTHYPHSYDIHGYCLGHKEFVSSLVLLNNETLVSVSGDATLRLWNYHSCNELSSIDLPAPGIKLQIRKLSEGKYQAAVLLYQETHNIALYNINQAIDGNWKIAQNSVLSFPDMIVVNLCYANDRLYVVSIVDEHLKLNVANIPDSCSPPPNWLQMVEEQFQQDIWQPEDISQRFRKNFDNISEYLARKRKRIEEKQK